MLNKVFLIISREYLSRVRKKSFIIMTVLTPLLIMTFYGAVIYISVNRHLGESEKNILIDDASGFFSDKLESNDYIKFTYGKIESGTESGLLSNSNIYGIIKIPKAEHPSKVNNLVLIANEQASMTTVSYIEKSLEKVVKDYQLRESGIDAEEIKRINQSSIHVQTQKRTENGIVSGNATISTIIGYVGAFLIYMFIFLYGVQVMRGVIEEKSNRIVEVLISTVKPFELMMGKIIGIVMVGLTQLIIWVGLIIILGSIISVSFLSQVNPSDNQLADTINQIDQSPFDLNMMMQSLGNFNFTYIILVFIFYFISGYMFYSGLFAAVGSAVDNETDTQQFMLPITIPMIFALMLSQSVVITDPNGTLSFWLSIIPLTSPIIMMVRLPFGVPVWELILSMSVMVIGFVFVVWVASRIYRVGILMYGKKATYAEIFKWIFYKE